ncbi:uncharacterized protein LOC109718823 [Ananas comosus]|uniref:Uncharacterized protein LOC109718823 n=1 Tax=Ananas comosus TaxID=4615 RepID=A0A6P5FZ21_ANACO|nr:uncharacterized protein LOC109718823 [Ananas comosus]
MDMEIQEEMEMLLNEIPHATSPRLHHHHHHHPHHPHHINHHDHGHGHGHHHLHHGGHGGYPSHGNGHGMDDDGVVKYHVVPIHGMYGAAADDPSAFRGLHHGHGIMDGHACLSPPPFLSDESPASSSLSGTPSPMGDDDAVGNERLVEKLLSMHITPPTMAQSICENNPIDPSLFRSHSQYNFVKNGVQTDVNSTPSSVLAQSLLFNESTMHCSSDFHPNDATTLQRGFSLWGEEEEHVDHFFPGMDAGDFFPAMDADDFFPSAFYSTVPNGESVLSPSCISSPNALHKNYQNIENFGFKDSFDVYGRGINEFSLNSLDSRCLPRRNRQNVENFGFEDSLIIQGRDLHYAGNRSFENTKSRKKMQFNEKSHFRGNRFENMGSLCSVMCPNLCKSPNFSVKDESLMDVKGKATDQQGCRVLQHKLDEGKHMVDAIFHGIADHVVELMEDQFGNYLMQKLLGVCDEEQRMSIVVALTKDPINLVGISLNMHGTRAVQKLIETLKIKQQISLVVSALKLGFLDLIKDLNGNHVLQCCLERLPLEDNKFIFDAAAIHCVDIATHSQGCCVLQRCIKHSTGKERMALVEKVSANGFQLAQDPYGNYAVQCVMDLEIPRVIVNLKSQFEGKYVLLSTQKFSSNVVEKCLTVFGDDDRATIIFELLSVSNFDRLLQDPFANYVIYCAIQNTKGSLHAALIEAILPHAPMLRTSPYCKRIFALILPRK